MFPMPYGEPLVRLRRRMAPDPYSGESTRSDWSAPDSLDLEGAAIAPSSSTERASTFNRQTVITSMSIYGPAGMDVLPGDRIKARTKLWEVTGEKADWRNPLTGWEPGVELPVERMTG